MISLGNRTIDGVGHRSQRASVLIYQNYVLSLSTVQSLHLYNLYGIVWQVSKVMNNQLRILTKATNPYGLGVQRLLVGVWVTELAYLHPSVCLPPITKKESKCLYGGSHM